MYTSIVAKYYAMVAFCGDKTILLSSYLLIHVLVLCCVCTH